MSLCRWRQRFGLALALLLACAPSASRQAFAATKSSAGVPSKTKPQKGQERDHWLDEPEKHEAQPATKAPFLLGLAVLGLSAAAVFLRFVLKQRGLVGDTVLSGQDALRVIGQRHLGGSQALVLVEVLGERLLLAKNSEETTLLTHLPAAFADDSTSEKEELSPKASVPPPPASTSPSAASLTPGVAARQQASGPVQAPDLVAIPSSPDENLPLDLRGLRQWQAEAHGSLRGGV